MERFMGIEEARGKLGDLAQEVEQRGEPVVLTRRGRPLAVLLSRDEYGRFKLSETAAARAELERHLAKVRHSVRGTALKRSVVDEAIAAVRRAR
jgi:prevent-host-death family protein